MAPVASADVAFTVMRMETVRAAKIPLRMRDPTLLNKIGRY
jgi:hypothetical protein